MYISDYMLTPGVEEGQPIVTLFLVSCFQLRQLLILANYGHFEAHSVLQRPKFSLFSFSMPGIVFFLS